MGKEAAMSKTPIDPADEDLGHLAAGGPAYIVTGADRLVATAVYDDEAAAVEAMTVKSVRLPQALIRAAEQAGHPDGFSGVVREAVAEWLHTHAGGPAVADDARHALAVLQRALAALERSAG